LAGEFSGWSSARARINANGSYSALTRILANFLGEPAGSDHAAIGFATLDSVSQQIELSHHPESDNGEMMIKRVGEPYSRPLHDDEAGCVDSGQFVQVGAPEIFP